jgi:hypothetical protein
LAVAVLSGPVTLPQSRLTSVLVGSILLGGVT